MPNNSRKEKDKKLHKELIKQMLTLATSGFGLVAALAWNSLIQEFVNSYVKKFLPDGSGIYSLLIYAVIITVLAVFVTYQLSKLSEKINE
jgi:Na+-translocating ferredoxin:NAD+ oxidoreductase RnfD subunit